jgi:serine protease Do
MLRSPVSDTRPLGRLRWIFLLALLGLPLAAGQDRPAVDGAAVDGAAVDGAAVAIAALQARCVAAVADAEKSVVAIARVSRDERTAGFQVPNLGRLALNPRLEELFPTDPDFLPADFGAGVVVDASGLIVTTYHVLGPVNKSEYFVWSQHKPFKASVVAADGWSDLAVLRTDARDLQPLPLGDARTVAKGQFVIAVGNPQAIARDGQVSATWGMVANLNRRAPQSNRANAIAGRDTLHHYGTLIHVDSRLHLGYSGGALLNLDGKMIGLLTAYTGSPAESQSASFAIPVDEHFRRTLQRLMAGKSPEFGFLGVGLQSLDARVRRQGLHGSLVDSVTPGSAAARAEIRSGDVITHCNEVPIHDDDDLIREVSSHAPGQSVRLRLQRTGDSPTKVESLEKVVLLTKRSATALRPPIATVHPPSWRGMRVDDATAAPREALGSVPLPISGGLYVTEVAEDSPAWNAGLRSGVFITAMAGQPLTTAREFFALTGQHSGEVPLQILTATGATSVQTVSP